jgi:hypothetical protein
MQQAAARARRATYGIGLGFGLVAGLVGAAQWVLTERYLAEQCEAFLAIQRRSPGVFDATNLSRGTVFYWLGTAAWAAVAMFVLYLFAAFTAAWVQQRWRDGMVAARVAAAVSSALYVAATVVALVTSPAPSYTEGVLPCELPLGPVFFGVAMPYVRVGASLGLHAGRFFSRGRQAI